MTWSQKDYTRAPKQQTVAAAHVPLCVWTEVAISLVGAAVLRDMLCRTRSVVMLEWLTLILLVPLVLLPCVVLFGFAGCQYFFPLTPPDFKPTFEISFTAERNLPNICLVVRIEADRLSISGQAVRIVLQRPQTGDLVLRDVYISQAADSGDPYDAPVTPDGSLDPTLVATDVLLSPDPDPAQELVVLDPVSFALDEAKPVLIAINIGSTGHLPFVGTVLATDGQSYRGPSGVLEAAQADRTSGYVMENRIHLIRRIEVA